MESVDTVRTRGLWSSEGLAEVEALMDGLVAGERLDRLGAILREHLAAGGKRLRARLALGAVEALGGERVGAVGWAAACELLHNAALLHDDWQDRDRMRRGREAAWSRHGPAQAVNAGDLGLVLPVRAIREVAAPDASRWRLAELLAELAERVVRGQSEELELLPRRWLSRGHYLRTTEAKTASQFVLPVAGAALLAGHAPGDARALAAEFAPIGTLFQVQDDVLDLWGDKGRDPRGSDLREGRVTAVVVEHLARRPLDREWLLALLETPREATTDLQVAHAMERFAESGVLDGVWSWVSDVEDAVVRSAALARHPRLHAVAVELVAMAVAPIAHTLPAR